MKMELTSREHTDLFAAICTRIGHVKDLLKIPAFKEDKTYKNELDRLRNLKEKLQYNG
ncbi:hypothetical protein LCGC14_3110690 [marine sediment metagenome]|uniref:Uncharacterized protein n=1 Tax=marine sediment metagenome TaxID=412755 RepID=A0A0F8YCL7_9ZZZZ